MADPATNPAAAGFCFSGILMCVGLDQNWQPCEHRRRAHFIGDIDMHEQETCPCGSGKAYPACCGQYIEGGQRPDTAEQLMRSRYTAYARVQNDYLRKTWHPSTCPEDFGVAVTDAVKWLGLEIKRTAAGGANDAEGVVEFVARYKLNGKATRLHEVSRFVREEGQWLYLDGSFPDAKK